MTLLSGPGIRNFSVEKGYLQHRKYDVENHKKDHIKGCPVPILENHKKVIRPISQKFYRHREQVKLNKKIRLVGVIEVGKNGDSREGEKNQRFVKK